MNLKRMDDDEVLAGLSGLARDKHRNDAAMLAYIDEVERRRLFAREGWPSIFAYCVEVLRLSESAAGKRIRAARLGRRFPIAVDMIAGGELTISSLNVIGAHLTGENHRQVLDRCRGKTRQQIEHLVAELAPRPDVPASLRKLSQARTADPAPLFSTVATPAARTPEQQTPGPARSRTPEQQAPGPARSRTPELQTPGLARSPAGKPQQLATPGATPDSGHQPAARTVAPTLPRGKRRGSVEVLAPERYLLKVTLGARTRAKLERARTLVSHSVPDGDVEAVLERALDALIEKTEKRRFGKGARPRKAKPLSAGSRTIPASVARAVIAEHGERCCYQSADGHVCGSTWLLQLHHLDPFAKGGPATVENVAIVCRSHNQYAADVEFGRAFMQRRRQRRVRPANAPRAGEQTVLWSAAGQVWALTGEPVEVEVEIELSSMP
jgi:hypothetical protein